MLSLSSGGNSALSASMGGHPRCESAANSFLILAAGHLHGGLNLLGRTIFVAQRFEEIPLPFVDIILGDPLQQRGMPLAPLVERHGQRLRYGAGYRFDIIGVDEQGAFAVNG